MSQLCVNRLIMSSKSSIIMKINVTLHILTSKESGMFYISTKDREPLKKYVNKTLIIECNDFNSPLKYPGKISIRKNENYLHYVIYIPHIFYSLISKNGRKNQYILSINLL